jgi:ABC-type branched-subunit amino acid transport system substrate-binding protein
MLRRSFCGWTALVGAGLALGACANLGGFNTPPQVAAPLLPPPRPIQAGPPRVAILLPLTGPQAAIGQSILKAAQLALSPPGSPVLDVKDTTGDPATAAGVAQQAVMAGDRLILGPLTSDETKAVAGVARPAGIAVLAFTSDPNAAAPGVWTLGLTPSQQVRRLVGAARDDGRRRIAAVLPPGALGDALADALTAAASDAGLDAPAIQRSAGGLAGLSDSVKAVSGYEERHTNLERRIKSLQDQSDPDSRQQAAELAAQPVQPVPFDALLLGESGGVLRAAPQILAQNDIHVPQVRILGPALWANQAAGLGGLAGAWYAALDQASRAPFVQAYEAKYAGAAPSPFADYGFDAAAMAGELAQGNDFSPGAIARPEGFTGVDGAVVLLPDGHVRRALAVWQIDPGGGAHIVSPAPQDVSAQGS